MTAGQLSILGAPPPVRRVDIVDVSAGTLAEHCEIVPGAIEVDLGGPIRVLRLSVEDAIGWAEKLRELADKLEATEQVPEEP